jgi:hypothetical protein
MTAERHPSRSTRSTRRARRAATSLLALVVLATGTVACAQEGGGDDFAVEDTGGGTDGDSSAGGSGSGAAAEFAATADFLKETATKSAEESHRIEVRIGIDEVADSAPPAVTGEIDGPRSHMQMDLGVIMEEVSAGMGLGDLGTGLFGDADMTMETITDGDTLYLRAPFFATLGEMMPTGSTPGASELAALGDGWGSVSIPELGEMLPEDVAASVTGQQSFNPRAAVEMMENTEGVEDLGTEEIAGVSQHGLRAEVTFADLLRTSGMDPEAYVESLGGDAEGAMASLADMRMPVEVWVDDDGYLRTLTYSLALGQLVEAATDGAPGGDLGLGDLTVLYVVSFSDYGADFTFDAPADAADITSAFAEMYAG